MNGIPWLMLAALAAAFPALSATPEFAPGAGLAGLVRGEPVVERRYAIDAAPHGEPGTLPPAPVAPGDYWLVSYGADGAPLAWHRFRVAGEPGDAGGKVMLHVDREPPAATLSFAGPRHPGPDGLVLAPSAMPGIHLGADPAGATGGELVVDGEPVAIASDWAVGRPEGALTIGVASRDALGNQGITAATRIVLDRTPPQLEWRVLGQREGVPADVVGARDLRLHVRVVDALAGPGWLVIGDRRIDDPAALATGIEIDVPAGPLTFRVADAVDNVADGALPLRIDTDGPRLLAVGAGDVRPAEGLRMRRGDPVQLVAEDALAGVADACVEAGVWYGQCRALPVDLVGLGPGRYPMEFRAVDRLGNRSRQRLHVEVLP